MKLSRIQVNDFQSIRDSNPFEVGEITCLVGKNESGKTALLQAVYRLNPIIESEGNFDVINDYPRSDVEDYQQDIATGKRKPAIVTSATYTLDQQDLEPIHAQLGAKALQKPVLTLQKGYENKRFCNLDVNLQGVLEHLAGDAQLPPDIVAELTKCTAVDDAIAILNGQEKTAKVERLSGILSQIKDKGLVVYIYSTYLHSRVPKFLYFDEYYQMKGCENIQALKQRRADKKLLRSDHPMLGLIELARLDLDQLLNAKRTQELVNKLEGAGNHLGKKVLKYWSQNKHLLTKFDVRPALPEDPENMRTGTNIWAGVHDSRHQVTTNLGTRSRGFIWFFSFLAWYSQLQKNQERVILLLDEPGLSLHGKAQGDLLRYFEEELKPNHQLIYSTHSPFMVDPQHFDRVRIVQDKGIDTLDALPPEEEGTKVFTDVLEATEDSLFPLQGALGYEIHQTLFVGPNCLVVEGVSDLIYLQTMSALLERAGRQGLSSKWTITPVGGSDKVPTFVALLGSQKNLNVATLIDIQNKDRQTIENLYKKKLLSKNKILTFADFTGTPEADVEDMFEVSFYLQLVNQEFKVDLQKPIEVNDLDTHIPRMVARLEKYFVTNPMKSNIDFSHYRPARYLSEKADSLMADISQETLERFEHASKKLNALL
jgi:predicted ATP-dependent endonuclease of OLD family